MKNILSLLILFVSFNAAAQYSYAKANKAEKFAKTITEKDLKDHLYLTHLMNFKEEIQELLVKI